MKRLLSITLLVIALVTFAFNRPALAGDAGEGGKIFDTNCSSCHAGGINVVVPTKNLKKETLAQYDMNSLEAIITQVTNGRGAMPSFKSRLQPTDIENVATYVLEQSEKDWKS